MMTNAASTVCPQQMPIVEPQVDWSTKIAEVMREQFGLRPNQQSVMYKNPYPLAYNQIPHPHKYKMPDFTKFSGQGEVSTMEHVNRFLLQLGEAGNHDALRVRLFSLSLSGSACAWFTTLPTNSILYWADATVWFCPISSWRKWHLMGSCRTLKINIHRKSLKALARS